MSVNRLIIFSFLLAAAGAASAGDSDRRYAAISDDPHLAVVPRTDEEAARIARVVAPTSDFSAAEAFEARPGGAATSFATPNANAFSHPSANIDFERRGDFFVGNGFFRKLWVTAPSSTIGSDGLGPLYNARSCQRCHLKDGRGHPPEGPEDLAVSFFLRISVPAPPDDPAHAALSAAIEGWLATDPNPNYGLQIQDFAIPGMVAEAQVEIVYEEFEVALSDGETATPRRR